MKPKYKRFLKTAFPSIILLPAMAQLTTAAVINPDGYGNVLVTPVSNSGPNNIQTGYFPVAGAHEIRVDLGATVNPGSGDAIEVQVFDASLATYTINNNGTLSALNGAPGQHGIDTIDLAGAKPSIIVNNTGTISGFSAIRANNTLVLTNSGTLTGIGFADGAVFAKNGATITNNDGASIVGLANGIQSELVIGILDVHNDATVTGTNFDGITSPGIVRLTNSYQQTQGGASTVTGKVNGVVGLGNGSIIANSGRITATTGDGVRVGINATVSNYTSFATDPVFGGHITGGVNGVVAGNGLILNNHNLGLIAGGTGDGIHADLNATITNALGANITAGDDGIQAGAGAHITNDGTITAKYGIYLPNGNGVIVNTGTISGTGDGILIAGGPGVTVTNSGLITSAGLAIFGDVGNEVLNFNLNSRVVGTVKGGGGVDAINFNGGLTSPYSLGNSVSGNVVEFTDINKTGTGVAFIGLPGDPLYSITSRNISITGGGLYINAGIAGHTVAQATINAGGEALGGTGTWDANLLITSGGFSAGSIPIDLDVHPRNAVGLVTITGDVDHSAGSFIRFDVNPNTPILNGINSDLIRQTGVGNTYDIAGANLRISSTDNNQIIRNGTYTVVNSDEVITGSLGNVTVQFNPNVNSNDVGFIGSEVNPLAGSPYNNSNTVLANYFTIATKSSDQTDLLLVVQHDFAGLPGLTANGSSLGSALDASINTSNALTQDFIAALDNSNLLVVQNTLASLVPDALLDAASALISSNYRVNRLVQDHLAMTRSSGATLIETPATADAKGGVIPAKTTTSDRGSGNVWGTFSYDWKDSNSGNSNFKGEDASFTAGIDYRFAPDCLVGILLDGSRGNYDYAGGSSDVDSLRVGIYGTYGQATGIYADFFAAYGDHSMDVDRALGGILSGTSNSSADATSIQAMLTVGYAMTYDKIKHGPFIGLEYQNIDVDGYTQTGPYPINVSSLSIDSIRGLIGYRAEASYGQFSPYASVAYAHEFEDGSISTTASIPGGAAFRVNGGGLGSAILISVGTGYAFTPKLGLNIGYHGELAVSGDGMDSNGGYIGLNYSF
ncbi:MAG: autotransporter outer membrane beta-barrel domain-containing protein [Verrucomicrobiota bacterium]